MREYEGKEEETGDRGFLGTLDEGGHSWFFFRKISQISPPEGNWWKVQEFWLPGVWEVSLWPVNSWQPVLQSCSYTSHTRASWLCILGITSHTLVNSPSFLGQHLHLWTQTSVFKKVQGTVFTVNSAAVCARNFRLHVMQLKEKLNVIIYHLLSKVTLLLFTFSSIVDA